MQFIKDNSRHQTYFSTLEEQVSADNAVRLMDAFIEKKLAIIAVANKLLKQVFGVVKNECMFN